MASHHGPSLVPRTVTDVLAAVRQRHKVDRRVITDKLAICEKLIPKALCFSRSIWIQRNGDRPAFRDRQQLLPLMG